MSDDDKQDAADRHLAGIMGGEPAMDTSIHAWLQRMMRLGEGELLGLVPVLDAGDDADALRKLVGLAAELADPGCVMNDWLAIPCDTFIRRLYRLRMAAGVLVALDRGEPAEYVTLDAWCRRVLADEARIDPGLRARLTRWFVNLLAEHDPELSWLCEALAQHGESEGDDLMSSTEGAPASRRAC